KALQFHTHINELASSKVLIGNEYFLIKDLAILESQSSSVPGTLVKFGSSGMVVSTKTHDVCLNKISNIYGEAIEVDGVLHQKGISPGTIFVDYFDPVLVSAYESICLNETYWISRLKEFVPSILPFSNARFSSSQGGVQHEILRFEL